jgi:hypothetical protein
MSIDGVHIADQLWIQWARCALLLMISLLSGCSGGGCTLPNAQQADVFACLQD